MILGECRCYRESRGHWLFFPFRGNVGYSAVGERGDWFVYIDGENVGPFKTLRDVGEKVSSLPARWYDPHEDGAG